MKKNLLYVWTLACVTSLFVGCSSENDNENSEGEPTVSVSTIVGTYRGNMDIVMIPDDSSQEMVIAEDLTKNIFITQVSTSEIKVELKDFDLIVNETPFKLGDITIEKCKVTKDGASYSFTGWQNLTFEGAAAALGTCKTSVEGEVKWGDMDMEILVKVPTLQQTVKVNFEGVKLTTDAGTYYDFETWVQVGTGPTSEFVYYNPVGWSSNNAGVELLTRLGYADKFAVTQTHASHWGKSAASIETLNSKGAEVGGNKIPKVTAGSLFQGSYSADLATLSSDAKYGIPFVKKPLSLKGYYKYTPGADYYVCESQATCNVATVDPTKMDKFSIKAVLYTTPGYEEDFSDCLTDADINTSDRIVATASLTGGARPDWKLFNITLNYLKPYDSSLKYRFAIVCSSSYDGSNFNGAPGSVLIVDDFELISAE